MIGGQSNFLQSLGWALLNSLWQMALLWIVCQLIFGIFRKASPAHKTALATSAVMIGFGWFVYTFISILTAASPDNGALTAIVIDANNEQLNHWLSTTLPIASIAYLLLLVLPVFNYIRNYRYVQAIRRFELSKADIDWRIFVKDVAARLGIKKPVHVWLSGLVTSPVTIGYVKPVILLPLAAMSHLTPQQVEAILLHELAHIRRYDYLVNLVIRFIQAVLYFNPFIRSLVKTIEREREKSCDELVMQFQYDAYGYATALLTLEKVNSQPRALAVAASGRKNDLLHRIECLMGVQKKQAVSFNKLAGLMAGLLCFIAFNALLILTKPVKQDQSIAALPRFSSPFFIYTGPEEASVEKTIPQTTEVAARSIVNTVKEETKRDAVVVRTDVKKDLNKEVREEQVSDEASPYSYTYTIPDVAYVAPPASLVNVSFSITPPMPELKAYQEIQVKDAVEASRKVLEEKQWKAIEATMADAVTSAEKMMLKSQYEKELSKVDWNRMEDQLRMAYDQIEWNKVNEELNKAMTELKIDSLQNAYTMALDQLSSLQKQLAENNLNGIPDTDINLKTVAETRRSLEKALSNLARIKARKVVHL